MELLHRGNDFTEIPKGSWEGRAPLLFPAVGRNYTDAQIKEGGGGDDTRYVAVDGVARHMPCHGFAMGSVFELVGHSSSESGGAQATCALRVRNAESSGNESYPFDFDLVVVYTLFSGNLNCAMTVSRFSGGPETMPMSFGSHPTFRFPFIPNAKGASWGEGRLRGAVQHENVLLPCSVLSGETISRKADFGGDAGDFIMNLF